jgi:glycolate oxidase iron-sulfur subunit
VPHLPGSGCARNPEMDTVLAEAFRDTAIGREAEALLRPCVQCGQCTFICPTFRLLDDERDGPRGRIFMIHELFEGKDPGADIRLHLDRCLTCRSCEHSCPQGVRYGRLLDLAREVVEQRMPRPLGQRLARRALRAMVSHRRRFTALLRVGQALRGLLPGALRCRIPQKRPAGDWPARPHERTMLVWPGCVQPAVAPDINAAAARVLDRFGIRLLAAETGCCGALSYHLAAPEEARTFMRRNIDACWPQIEAGAEAIVMTSSGCGAHVRDYGYLLRDDPAYRDKARRFSEMIRDIAEVVAAEWREDSPVSPATGATGMRAARLVFQSPCSLQHGMKMNGVVEKLLRRAGFTLVSAAYAFMCCGAAGSYSILQPALAQALRARKLDTLLACRPQAIATANVGCLIHLAAAAPVPVRHWIELLDEALERVPGVA